MSEPTQPAPVVALDGVRKLYGETAPTVALDTVSLTLERGEFAALIGPSGSGKSTLLNIVGLLEPPSAGTVHIVGRDTTTLDDHARTLLRGRSIGFVFQFHHLLPELTALENVLMPLAADRGRMSREIHPRGQALLGRVGLGDRASQRASTLSGGQQQRVAIARALVMQPALVLADEPTGNLDTRSSDQVFELMREVNRETGTAFLIVTHDPRIAERCDRKLEIVDGKLVRDTSR